ncbi:MAG TPA: iron dicitrate transport regulator FecR [Cytophagales bacterium]|nr:iron dicitrate transport regulator FecR [Cytophagales bacterium]
MFFTAPRWLAAACVGLLVLASFAALYTKTVSVLPGQQAVAVLPDGSKVTLNADSQIQYRPYWWWRKRTVELSGEAFFEAESGSTFSIHSVQGSTAVLGTSFNIYARQDIYEVYCASGVVSVSVNQHLPTDTLHPGMMLQSLNASLQRQTLSNDEPLAWLQHRFHAVGLPLPRVLAELERTYNIQIDVDTDWAAQQLYSGNFALPTTPDKPLSLVAVTFGLELAQTSDDTYVLTHSP